MEALLDWGYIGLFVGSFVAATVVPFSSDVLLVGMLAAGGNVWLSVLVATVGNWAGGLTSYWIGWIGDGNGSRNTCASNTRRWNAIKAKSIASAHGSPYLHGCPLSATCSPSRSDSIG